MSSPCLADTDCIALDINVDTALEATPIFSTDENNGVECRATGLWAPRGGLVVGTIPATGTDGDEIYYDYDAFTRWHFAYDAGEPSAFKWKFIGGPEAFSRVEAESDISNPDGSLVWSWDSGPTITLPLHGYYYARFGSAIDSSQDGFVAQVGIAKSGDDPGDDDIAENSNAHIVSVATEKRFPCDGSPVAAGSVCRLFRRADGDGSGTARYVHRYLAIHPRRVAA
jgi:hypothetical protein